MVVGFPRNTFCLAVVLCIGGGFGCRSFTSSFRVVDYTDSPQTRTFGETFPDAYYRQDADGLVDLVLMRTDRPADGAPLVQTMLVRAVWSPIPGRTVTESTQLNARVTYVISSGLSTLALEGSGSLFFAKQMWTDRLKGSVEYSALQPTRGNGKDLQLFERAMLTGTFHARHDPRKVVQVINQMERKLGPLGQGAFGTQSAAGPEAFGGASGPSGR